MPDPMRKQRPAPEALDAIVERYLADHPRKQELKDALRATVQNAASRVERPARPRRAGDDIEELFDNLPV